LNLSRDVMGAAIGLSGSQYGREPDPTNPVAFDLWDRRRAGETAWHGARPYSR